MFDVTSSMEIAVSREKIAAFAMDPANFPQFMEGVKSVEKKGEGPMGERSKVIMDANPGDPKKSKPITYTFILYTPGYVMRYKYLDGTFPAETTVSFEEIEDKPNVTLVKIRTKEQIEGLNKVVQPFLKSAAKGNNDKMLQKLKKLLERG
jgi:carbon monoxide dehydrogenase subunit G